jgi:DNA-binding transcriptional ArsR family regulator
LKGGKGVSRELQQFKAEFFKALAHPLRIRILEVLSEGEKNVNEIQAVLGLEGSAVSQQLAVLRAKNVVSGVKDGTNVIYSLRSCWKSPNASSTTISSMRSRCWRRFEASERVQNEVDRRRASTASFLVRDSACRGRRRRFCLPHRVKPAYNGVNPF